MIRRIKNINISIIFVLSLIACIGFAMLYSAGGGSFSPWAYKQIIRFVASLLILIAISSVDINTWYRLAYIFYSVSFLFLLGVETMGFVGMGAQR